MSRYLTLLVFISLLSGCESTKAISTIDDQATEQADLEAREALSKQVPPLPANLKVLPLGATPRPAERYIPPDKVRKQWQEDRDRADQCPIQYQSLLNQISIRGIETELRAKP